MEVRDGWETLVKVWDWSRDSLDSPGQVGGLSGRFGMGRGTFGDGLGDSWGGPGWVGGHSWRSGTGRRTLREDWNGSADAPGVPARVGGTSERS